MRAPIADQIAHQPFAAAAAAIVRSCVHCGFCNATCPTYQLTGDELEGPRGRIYLIKSLLEDGSAGTATRQHLDQCLVCRNCETTCPSEVRYGELLELVRPHINATTRQSWWARLKRHALVKVVPYRRRLAPLVGIARVLGPLLPRGLAELVPPAPPALQAIASTHPRRVLVLGGCAQPVFNPNIDIAAGLVFDRLGITLLQAPASGCCGALALHLGYEDDARVQAMRNIDAWSSFIDDGVEAVIASSSACALQLKQYAQLLHDEPAYAARASAIQALVRDPVELIDSAVLAPQLALSRGTRIAVQSPCTLQHGERLGGRLEALLTELGWTVQPVAESHLCCGAAGSHAVLYPERAAALRERKLANLLADAPELLVTANIGCQLHLAGAAPIRVMHWLELLASRLGRA